MGEQQILWNLLMLAMLAGVIYSAWAMGTFQIGMIGSSPAAGRSLVPVAKPVGHEEQAKAKKPKRIAQRIAHCVAQKGLERRTNVSTMRCGNMTIARGGR